MEDKRLSILDKKPELLHTFLLNRILIEVKLLGWIIIMAAVLVIGSISTSIFDVGFSFVIIILVLIYVLFKGKVFKKSESHWLNEINGIK